MYCIPMITTEYFFQNFHLYDNTMLRNFFCGKFIFHVDLHREIFSKCFSILVVISDGELAVSFSSEQAQSHITPISYISPHRTE